MSVKSIQHNELKTTYPDIVYTIEPIIKQSTQILRILRWEEGYTRQSIIFTLSWTFLCLHPKLVVYITPILIAAILYHNYHYSMEISKVETTTNSFEKLTATLKDIQFELALILPSPENYDRFKQWYRSLFALSKAQQLVRFITVYVFWIVSLKLFGLDKIIWFLGCLALTWCSSLSNVLCYSYHRAAFILRHANQTMVSQLQPVMTSPKQHLRTSSSQEHYDRFFRFNVLEHQRWWLAKGWSTLLLPNERPQWSDEYLVRVPSINKFQLPPAITKFDKKTEKMVKITWQWMSEEWEIDESRNVDKDGWEYGGWDWKSWGSKSSGLRVLTRRRYWARNARLIEQEIDDTSRSMPITIQRSNSTSTYASLSTSSSIASSEDSSYLLCTTPTNVSFQSNKKLYVTSTVGSVEQKTTTPLFSDISTVDHHFWLRR